jgi:hypothetical protein
VLTLFDGFSSNVGNVSPTSCGSCDSPNHSTIHEVLDLLAVVLSEFAGCRRAHHHDKTLLRIAEKLRAIGAIPGELTRVTGDRG